MNSIAECLKQITSLTKKNLQIMKMINDSFYVKKDHLVSVIDGETYVIPSFLSLESKIDDIEANLQNILNAPKTGEAFTYYDGTTQKIELAGYSTVPPRVDLKSPETFSTSANHIFKDFMSPQPAVRFNIGSIANNIKHVLVKKVAIHDPNLLGLVLENVVSGESDVTEEGVVKRGSIGYGDLVKVLFNYEDGVGYTEYDTVRRLPLRVDSPTGEYDILEIVDNYQDSNFEEHYTLKLDRDLVYHVKNGTIMRNIAVGDYLVTYNDKVEMIVEDANPVNHTITVKILHGAYADLCDLSSGNIGMYRLRFHQVNLEAFEASKYIEVPLEEDGHVCIFIAPINDTTNTQAAFGTGSYLYTDYLMMDDTDFRKYYNDNVNNIGDALFAITNMMSDDDQVEKLTGSQFIELIRLKPTLNTDNITIYQINKHLNDSESVKKIRNLYNQKAHYKNELSDVEKSIDNINNILADSSFDDTGETRESYKAQLRELNAHRRELTGNISAIVGEISENANASDTPIENAKYHIRGFVNTQISASAEVIGIDVEYRYKNKNKFTGNAETINESYIYSDWNKMSGFMNAKIPEYNIVTNKYSYKWEEHNEDKNVPSFNQIDIPISQGENVDIRVRFIYNLGWPLVTFRSEWSDVLNVEFPEEFVKDIEILDIIAENNDDIKNQKFIGILEKEGIINHVEDKIVDMDLTYFHHPEHIASGFYTPERRIIPLSDQLMSMAKTLADIQAEVNGATAQLKITISDGLQEIGLLPGVINNFRVRSYVDAVNNGSYQKMIFDRDPSGSEMSDNKVEAPMAVSNLVLNIYNSSDFTIKLHSLFPGDNDVVLDDSAAANKFGYINYTGGGTCADEGVTPTSSTVTGYSYGNEDSFNEGVWMLLSDNTSQSGMFPIMQRMNQFIYFRTKVDGKSLYSSGAFDGLSYHTVMQSTDNDNFNGKWPDNLLSSHRDCIYESLSELKYMFKDTGTTNPYKGLASLYPYIGSIEDISAPSGSSFYELKPGESVNVPLNFVYWLYGGNVQAEGDDNTNSRRLDQPFDNKISRAIVFDLRTSLFADPVTYKLVVEAHYQDLQTFKAVKTNKDSRPYNPVVYYGKKRG